MNGSDIFFNPAYMGLPMNVYHPLVSGPVYDDGSGVWFARFGMAVVAVLIVWGFCRILRAVLT